MEHEQDLLERGVYEADRTREKFVRAIRQLSEKMPDKLRVDAPRLEALISDELGDSAKVTELEWYDCLVGYLATVQVNNTVNQIMLQLGIDEITVCPEYSVIPRLTVIEGRTHKRIESSQTTSERQHQVTSG